MMRGSVSGDVPNIFWTACHWTGDEKYLKVLDYRIARSGIGALSRLNDNFIDELGKRDTWGKALTDNAAPDKDFENFVAWETTGDKTYLEQLYADAIRQKSQSMYFNTEGHWWSDRVEARHDLLQRARLGGVALSRNKTYPGHRVSWRFDDSDGALHVALLMPRAQRDQFKVIAYNTSDKPQSAKMTGWNIAAGEWQVKTGIDTTGDDKANKQHEQRRVHFEKTKTLDFTFPPKATLIIDMQLHKATAPVEQRPDLCIGRGDVTLKGNQLVVTVHSLGHDDTSAGVLVVEDREGNEIQRATIPPLAAPTDLLPKTAQLQVKLPRGFNTKTARVRVALANGAAEITQANNQLDSSRWNIYP